MFVRVSVCWGTTSKWQGVLRSLTSFLHFLVFVCLLWKDESGRGKRGFMLFFPSRWVLSKLQLSFITFRGESLARLEQLLQLLVLTIYWGLSSFIFEAENQVKFSGWAVKSPCGDALLTLTWNHSVVATGCPLKWVPVTLVSLLSSISPCLDCWLTPSI